jgi:hypothetical protein
MRKKALTLRARCRFAPFQPREAGLKWRYRTDVKRWFFKALRALKNHLLGE